MFIGTFLTGDFVAKFLLLLKKRENSSKRSIFVLALFWNCHLQIKGNKHLKQKVAVSPVSFIQYPLTVSWTIFEFIYLEMIYIIVFVVFIDGCRVAKGK